MNRPTRALQGTLLFNRRGGGARLIGEGDRLIAWVAEQSTGTALHGDRVEAKPLSGQNFREGDSAQVTKVITRAHDQLVGTYQRQKNSAFVLPDDSRMPPSILVRPGGPALARPPRAGDKVVVALEPWTDARVSPTGKVIEILGATGEKGVDMLSIIRAHALPGPFPEEVVQEAEAFSEQLPEEEISQREDRRGDFVLTMDPDDAKDHDDAVSVDKIAQGWRLSVHIADVAYYVRPGTALDHEAQRRGNSTYLADRVIPMLPPRLSADLCSLREGVDRFAQSAFIDFTAQGRIRKVRFARTVIRVHSRLTYRQGAALLRGEKVPGFAVAVGQQLRQAWKLAEMLRKNRFAAGSLDLDFPEVKVWLDAEGRAERIERVTHDASHQLVEEFMLAANEAVAHEIKNRPTPGIYRIHEKPDPDRLEEFRKTAKAQGLHLSDLTQRKEVMRMLKAIQTRPDQFRLKLDFLKSLRRASYSPDPLGHYGLAKADYLHFTSPIRRYADLIAHRALARDRVMKRKDLTALSEHLSETERTSAAAEQDSVLLKKLEYFQRQLDSRQPQILQAVVREVKAHGLLIEVPEVDATGFIEMGLLRDGPWDFDRARLRLVNRRSKAVLQAGSALPVRIRAVDVLKRSLDFAPGD